jgi:hypothetical protein
VAEEMNGKTKIPWFYQRIGQEKPTPGSDYFEINIATHNPTGLRVGL